MLCGQQGLQVGEQGLLLLLGLLRRSGLGGGRLPGHIWRDPTQGFQYVGKGAGCCLPP